MPEESRINGLLARMGPDDREIVASLLETAFVDGVHTTLAQLLVQSSTVRLSSRRPEWTRALSR